jgi:Ser/Thr protein kinase RdoA (MazF antagonist)
MPLPSLTNQHALSARSVHWICEVYGLGEVAGYEALAAGYLNNNYRVETDRGCFFLKHHIKARRASLDEQHRLLGSLQEAGVPVAAPLADPYGRTHVTVSHRPVSVYAWIEGSHRSGPALTSEDCEAVGGLLGRVHRALAAMGDAAQQPFLLPPIQQERTLAKVREIRRRIDARQPRDAFDGLAEEWLDFMVDQLGQVERRAGDDPCLTVWQLTHGDFNPKNVLFGADGTMTIIDWDRVRVQPRWFELLRTLALWLIDTETGSISLEAARRMLRGYARQVPLEPELVPGLIEYYWQQMLNHLWILDWHYLQANPTADDLAASSLRWLRWLTAHRHELTEVLAGEAGDSTRSP